MAEPVGLRICHRCGAEAPEGPYCSQACRGEARALAKADEPWTPPAAFTEAMRAARQRERSFR